MNNVKRKDALKSLLCIQPDSDSADGQSPDEDKPAEAELTPTGAVRAMGLSLQKLTAEAETGRLLKQQLTQGLQIVELAPAEVDPSFITDRLAEPEEVDFAALIESIKTNGQQAGRFQVAYGHRRLRVAEILQLKVKAVVRELNDEEMVIAQGKENNDRRDRRRHFGSLAGTQKDQALNPEEFIAHDDKVVVLGRYSFLYH